MKSIMEKIILAIAIILLAAGSYSCVVPQRAPVEQKGGAREKGRKALVNQEWDKAIEIFNRLISKGGINSDYVGRAWAYENKGQYDDALNDLYYVCSHSPHKDYYTRIFRMEKKRDPVSGYERALNGYVRDLGSSDAYLKRAEYFEENRRFKEAISDYKKIPSLLIKEGDTHAVHKYRYRQKIYYLKLELGMAEEALSDIGSTSRDYILNMGMNPGNNQYTSQWINFFNIDRGNAYNYLGDYENALSALNKSLSSENYGSDWAYYYLGEMEMFRGNYNEAIKYFDEVKNNNEFYPYWKAKTMTAYCLSELDRYEDAISTLGLAESNHKSHSWAKKSDFNTINSIKAYIYYQNDLKEEALNLINQTVSSEPNNPYLLLIQARIYALGENIEKALDSFSEALKNNMCHMGYLDMSAGDLRKVVASERGRSLLAEYNISSPLYATNYSSSTPGKVKITAQGYSGREKRLALVIGNGTYRHGGMLANPENDARDVSSVLEHLGFDVMTFENQSQYDMKRAVDEFGRRLKEYDVGLFFYAGHGLQAKGINYLVPVDALIEDESDVEFTCLDAGRVLTRMEDAENRINIVILDACRDNPFERSWTRSSKGRGLARMDAPTGSIIAYATEPGNTASDGTGRNGLYTSALLEEMQKPDVIIERVFRQVRTKVIEWSGKKQTPWESTSLTGDFFFNK